MFQNARNNKAIHHVADAIQSLVEMGIRPASIHFNESKPKVVLQQPLAGTNLGAAYCYSWGKDNHGRFYELHMLPMRDINLVWKTYPKIKSTLRVSATDTATSPSPNQASVTPTVQRTLDIAPELRPRTTNRPCNDIWFSIPA